MPLFPERVRRLGFRGVLVLAWVAAGYYLLFGGVYSVLDMRGLEREHASSLERADSLIRLTDSLVLRGDSLETDSASIERIAREKHGLVREGEELYRFREPSDTDGPPPAPVDE
ncbi:MAG: septum formation initiator family protein [Gemmatimonadota bacterium]